MNFYSNNLDRNKFLKIHLKYRKHFSKSFLIQNLGLFAGDKAFYKLLKCFEIVNEIKNVKGAIIEFGVWNGNNLISMKKILDYLKIKKKIIGYDNFLGMEKKNKKNSFIGDIKLIKYIIRFFKLDNINTSFIKDNLKQSRIITGELSIGKKKIELDEHRERAEFQYK